MPIMQQVYIGVSIVLAALMFVPRPAVDLMGMTRRQRLLNRWPSIASAFIGVIALFAFFHPMNFSSKDVTVPVTTDFVGIVDNSLSMRFPINPHAKDALLKMPETQAQASAQAFIDVAHRYPLSGFGLTLFNVDGVTQTSTISDGGADINVDLTVPEFTHFSRSSYDKALMGGLDQLSADQNSGRRHVLILVTDDQSMSGFDNAHNLAARFADGDVDFYLVLVNEPGYNYKPGRDTRAIRAFAEFVSDKSHIINVSSEAELDQAYQTIYNAEGKRMQVETQYQTTFVWQPAAVILAVMTLGLLLIGWGPGSNLKPDSGDLDT